MTYFPRLLGLVPGTPAPIPIWMGWDLARRCPQGHLQEERWAQISQDW